MRRVCAWCKSVLDGGPPVQPEEDITHTVCPPCSDRFLESASDGMQHDIDSVEIVDIDGEYPTRMIGRRGELVLDMIESQPDVLAELAFDFAVVCDELGQETAAGLWMAAALELAAGGSK